MLDRGDEGAKWPSASVKASRICSTGSMSHRYAIAGRGVEGVACVRDRARGVDGERISHAQSGASVKYAVSGSSGMRSRRHPARSGTRTLIVEVELGLVEDPPPAPGPPSPSSNGGPSLLMSRARGARVPGARAAGVGVERAADELGDDVLGGRRARPGTWRVAASVAGWRRSARSSQFAFSSDPDSTLPDGKCPTARLALSSQGLSRRRSRPRRASGCVPAVLPNE